MTFYSLMLKKNTKILNNYLNLIINIIILFTYLNPDKKERLKNDEK